MTWRRRLPFPWPLPLVRGLALAICGLALLGAGQAPALSAEPSPAPSGAGPAPALPPAAVKPPAGPVTAVLQGLDKTTARVSTFDAPVGQTVRFGTLAIAVRDCRKRPPEEEPESAAYLEIDEVRPGEAKEEQVFKGWMFASSPAVSALEHPVYDVWVIDCKNAAASTGSSG